jgi:hypothetical protein
MNKLSLHEDMTLRDGPLMKGGRIFRYSVHGLPLGSGAMIHDDGTAENPRWHIIRIEGDKWGDPSGDFKSADEALAILESEQAG